MDNRQIIPTCGRPGVERGRNPSKRKFEEERVAKLLHFGAARINFQFQTNHFIWIALVKQYAGVIFRTASY